MVKLEKPETRDKENKEKSKQYSDNRRHAIDNEVIEREKVYIKNIH